jgi:hypothetical protein
MVNQVDIHLYSMVHRNILRLFVLDLRNHYRFHCLVLRFVCFNHAVLCPLPINAHCQVHCLVRLEHILYLDLQWIHCQWPLYQCLLRQICLSLRYDLLGLNVLHFLANHLPNYHHCCRSCRHPHLLGCYLLVTNTSVKDRDKTDKEVRLISKH